jgi:hypothetical protein
LRYGRTRSKDRHVRSGDHTQAAVRHGKFWFSCYPLAVESHVSTMPKYELLPENAADGDGQDRGIVIAFFNANSGLGGLQWLVGGDG